VLDGIGSLLIGLLLGVTAWLLAKETKSLLIGERADQAIVDSILRTRRAVPAGGLPGSPSRAARQAGVAFSPAASRQKGLRPAG
jgi:divalent metal cation (Fe/Co/Zn/Cd) transporter